MAGLDEEIEDGGTFIINVPSDITMYTNSLSCTVTNAANSAELDVDGCAGSGQVFTVTLGEDVDAS